MSGHAQTRIEPTLHRVDERVRSFAKERPLLAVAGALVGGYLVGRMMAWRR